MSPFPLPDDTDNNLAPDPSQNGGGMYRESSPNEEEIGIPLDQGERFDRARRSAIKVYVVLILVGLLIGGVSLAGIVWLLQHFGLTDVPVQVEQN